MPAYLNGPPRHRREGSAPALHRRPITAPTAPPPVAAASSTTTAAADPLADLSTLYDKKLVVCGGFGTEATDVAQWRSMWAAFKQYGDGDDPPREELECARGCSYYCGDCHALTLADKTVRRPHNSAQFGAAQFSDALRLSRAGATAVGRPLVWRRGRRAAPANRPHADRAPPRRSSHPPRRPQPAT